MSFCAKCGNKIGNEFYCITCGSENANKPQDIFANSQITDEEDTFNSYEQCDRQSATKAPDADPRFTPFLIWALFNLFGCCMHFGIISLILLFVYKDREPLERDKYFNYVKIINILLHVQLLHDAQELQVELLAVFAAGASNRNQEILASV